MYKMLFWTMESPQQFVDDLNRQAEQGWRVHTLTKAGADRYEILFERRDEGGRLEYASSTDMFVPLPEILARVKL